MVVKHWDIVAPMYMLLEASIVFVMLCSHLSCMLSVTLAFIAA